ncbi:MULTISPECIES: sigma-70 family RNA polymerase sigma factor [unclassified Microcoleus]|uniref:sigma-70 family RNA polymerase sigma factor n=1 Tax=unclassified Microcoleus TaxID=2642155 RepID=UPI002FD173B7
MEITTHRSQRIRSSSRSVPPSIQGDEPEEINSDFWQEWQVHQAHFYRCCLKWMNSNPIDAEEVLSQAMLKAWNEWQNYRSKIKYPQAWLTRIIHNFCMDVHRKRKREALAIENIDDIKFEGYPAFASRVGFPDSNILDLELRAYIHQKIESLPPKLRDTFVLYYYQNKSYQDIAKVLPFSEQNVRKCVRKAGRILRRHLIKYLAGEDDTSLNSSSPALKLVIPLPEKSQPECNCESIIPPKSHDEEISYQVTVLCLETLPHHSYISTTLLVWR